jgi:ABC-type transporter Mla subunit MlaD
MTKERNHLKAGAFILVSAALIVAVIFSIRGFGQLFAAQQRRTVSFRLSDDLGGLQVGDEVRLGGFKVGVVEGIEVRGDVREVERAAGPAGPEAGGATRPTSAPAPKAEAEAPTTARTLTDADPDSGADANATANANAADADATRLLVTFTLPGEYELREDAVVVVQTTITGTASLNISSMGSGDAPPAGELALIGQPSGLNALLGTLGELSPELKPMLADARVAVADVKTRVVPRLGEALGTIKGAGAHLEDMLGESKGDFRQTVANLKETTGTVKEKLPPTMDNLRETTGTLKEKLPGTMDAAKAFIVRLDNTVKDTEGTLNDVKASVANFKDISAKAREVVGGNKGKLDSMIASLKTTGDNLKAASSEIRHSPWRLLYKPGKGEMANLNLYDSARQFADGAGNLNDAALALRDALEHKGAKPEEIEALLVKLDRSFTNFREVEDKLWTLVQE